MVCLGNICRSPLAHGILQSKLKDSDHFIDSAGTAAYHEGEPPDHRSINIARINGIDISQQRAKQFKESDFDDFDRIYAMDQSNLMNLQRLARNENDLDKIQLFMSVNPESNYLEVPDPYYGDFDSFKMVHDLIDQTCMIIAKELEQKN
jgi:protein-tyrosine phosphatase